VQEVFHSVLEGASNDESVGIGWWQGYRTEAVVAGLTCTSARCPHETRCVVQLVTIAECPKQNNLLNTAPDTTPSSPVVGGGGAVLRCSVAVCGCPRMCMGLSLSLSLIPLT
jgi:hypothetical protein